jgi:hypothetical protein
MAAEQVWLASLHLDGAAAEWYYSLEREYGMLPWLRFAEFVNLHFDPPIRFNPLRELKALQRTGMVEEYQHQFLMLLCRCDGLSPDHQMNLFTAGLSEPNDLQPTMSLARAFERRASAATPAHTTTSLRASYCPKPTVSIGSTASSTPTTTTAGTANPTKPRFRHLSPEEMANKRKQGECYFCPKKFSADHKCAMTGLFLMELEEEDHVAALADGLGISLHALTRLTGANTM